MSQKGPKIKCIFEKQRKETDSQLNAGLSYGQKVRIDFKHSPQQSENNDQDQSDDTDNQNSDSKENDNF